MRIGAQRPKRARLRSVPAANRTNHREKKKQGEKTESKRNVNEYEVNTQLASFPCSSDRAALHRGLRRVVFTPSHFSVRQPFCCFHCICVCVTRERFDAFLPSDICLNDENTIRRGTGCGKERMWVTRLCRNRIEHNEMPRVVPTASGK